MPVAEYSAILANNAKEILQKLLLKIKLKVQIKI